MPNRTEVLVHSPVKLILNYDDSTSIDLIQTFRSSTLGQNLLKVGYRVSDHYLVEQDKDCC